MIKHLLKTLKGKVIITYNSTVQRYFKYFILKVFIYFSEVIFTTINIYDFYINYYITYISLCPIYHIISILCSQMFFENKILLTA